MRKLFLTLLLILFQINFASAKHIYPEKYYQQVWCKENNGLLEYKLIDDTRVDCLTKDYAVEFDFAPKWAEAIGQSLHYSRLTGRKAGINLILESSDDFKYYHRIEPLCKKYDIALWYSEMPKNPPKDDYADFDLTYIFKIVVKFLNFIFSLFS